MTRNNKGFTLIEVMVAIAMIVIITVVIIGNAASSKKQNQDYRVRCVDGYKFVYSDDGSLRQLMNDNSKGIKCSE